MNDRHSNKPIFVSTSHGPVVIGQVRGRAAYFKKKEALRFPPGLTLPVPALKHLQAEKIERCVLEYGGEEFIAAPGDFFGPQSELVNRGQGEQRVLRWAGFKKPESPQLQLFDHNDTELNVSQF